MKKTLSLVLSLVMVLSVLTAIPFTAHAITEYSYTQDSSLGGNTFRYTLSGSEATITGFTALSAGTTDKSITIPSIMNGNTVVEIGEAVFNENENIESVSIPASVKTINSYAFNLCFGLSSVTFASDSELITIGEAAFASTAISSITFPSKLQYITKDAFEYCENLTSVTIPNSTKTIFGGAFANCTNLSTVTIGSKVSNIKSGAFTGCVALSSISVNSANETYSSASGVLYNKDKTTLILYPQGKSNTGFELRDETTTIADYAFEGNTALQQLLINSDSSLVSIGVGAFRGCSSLKSIMDIPDSLTTIGDEAFKGVANNLYVQSACDHPLVASAIIQGVSTRTWDMNHSGKGQYTVNENVVPATCTEDGTYDEVVRCSGCDTEFSRTARTVDELGHDYNDVVTAPTCTEQGYTMYTCSRCDDSYIGNYVDALGHTEVIDKAVAATCTKTGLTQGSHCSVCGTVITAQKTVAKKAHTLTTLDAVASTCTKEGKTEGKKCTACGAVTVAQQTVAKKAHTLTTLDAVAATCTKEGKTEGKKCTACGAVTVAQKTVAKKAHSYKNVTTKATLSKNGKVENKCEFCGAVFSESVIAKVSEIYLDESKFVYDGTAQKPIVIVKDSAGKSLKVNTDFTIEYKNNIAVGTGTVVVKLTGDKYEGEKVLEFTIVAAGGNTGNNGGTTTPGGNTGNNGGTTTPGGNTGNNGGTTTPGGNTGNNGGTTTPGGSTTPGGTTTPDTNHKHTEVTLPAKAATYTATGLTEGKKCSTCGAILVAQKKVARKKLKKVSSLKVKKTSSTYVTLSWKKVTGADSYKVYYSTDGKKWTKVKVKKNTATIKKLKSGTQYRFKVRAFAGKYYGTASKVVKKTTKVKKPTLSSVKSSKKKTAVVTWKKVTNANGYVVEYSTSKKFTKKTTKKVTIKKGKTVKTTLKKLKSGKKYYFKVRAYKKTASGTVYSVWSAVKSVKVK